MVAETPNTVLLRLDSVKNGESFRVVGTIRKTVRKLYFRNECYVWEITTASFESITLMTQKNIILVFAGEDNEYLLTSSTYFF